MKKIYSLFCLLLIIKLTSAQATLPLPYSLASNAYTLYSWDSASAAGTYPANMVFHYTISSESPYYNHLAEAARDFDCPYNLVARNRIIGLGANGIAFLATSSAQYNDCTSGDADTNRYVGDAVLAVNTTGKSSVNVSWTGVVIAVGDGSSGTAPARQATIRLQYRVGVSGNYTDVLDGNNDTVECNSTGKTAGTNVMLTTNLPAACDNQPLVYLRWVYFAVPTDGAKGTRPEISLDDITVGYGLLPLNLLSFGVTNSNGVAALSWKTSGEVNMSHFEVERSSNGNGYNTIASVVAKGNSNSNVYSLTDTKAITGNTFYRLKMVNKDGTYTYSGVVMFAANGLHILSVTPNPVSGKFILTHPQATTNTRIAIFGFDGKKLASYPVTANAVQTSINASGLAKGNYLLLFTDGRQNLTVKFQMN